MIANDHGVSSGDDDPVLNNIMVKFYTCVNILKTTELYTLKDRIKKGRDINPVIIPVLQMIKTELLKIRIYPRSHS